MNFFAVGASLQQLGSKAMGLRGGVTVGEGSGVANQTGQKTLSTFSRQRNLQLCQQLSNQLRGSRSLGNKDFVVHLGFITNVMINVYHHDIAQIPPEESRRCVPARNPLRPRVSNRRSSPNRFF